MPSEATSPIVTRNPAARIIECSCIDSFNAVGDMLEHSISSVEQDFYSVLRGRLVKIRLPKLGVSLSAMMLMATPVLADATNIVLVHGMNADGSSWRPVHDILVSKGYDVSVVQLPLTGFEQDVAATRRILDWKTGPVVLVAHSYGGVVITEAGNDQKVGALVYVAAIQPDVGETMGSLNEKMPSAFDVSSSSFSSDGYVISSEEAFVRDAAADVPKNDAIFLANSQTPTSTQVFSAEITAAAWQNKPSFGVVATEDRTVNPDLERWMYGRSGTKVTEIESSHMVQMSHPDEVASVIIEAAKAAD
jgi:pimeloyl-ACP methyl ester carboxylesterase